MVNRPKIGHLSSEVELKILCFLHYRYVQNPKTAFTTEKLFECIPCSGLGILEYSIDRLVNQNFLAKDLVNDGGQRLVAYMINQNGIAAVDKWDDVRYAEISEGVDFLEDNDVNDGGQIWSRQESLEPIQTDVVELVLKQLSECKSRISSSEFTQEEKAQVLGLLEACRSLIELPSPKLGLIKKVLGWLRDIATIKELVDQILAALDGIEI